MWLKRSKLPYLPWLRFLNPFFFFSEFEFVLGEGQVIAGWDLGLRDMCVGELRELVVPHQYGYGEFPVGDKIPPRALLVFYVELLRIGDPSEDMAKPNVFKEIDVNGDGMISHSEVGRKIRRLPLNPLNPRIKIWILICCFYSFPTEVVGRSWKNIKQIHLDWSCP